MVLHKETNKEIDMKVIEEIAAHFGIFVMLDGTISVPNWDSVLKNYEEFRQLAEKETTSRWHQERNMLTHTKMVCEKMAEYIGQAQHLSDEYRLILMLAAMFHDVGKCKCQNSPEGKLLSNGHPLISERICRKLLWGLDVVNRERICEMVRWHDLYCSSNISDRKLKTKLNSLSMWMFLHTDMLFMLWKADDHGSLKDPELEGSSEGMIERVKNIQHNCEFHHIDIKNLSSDFTIYVMCGLPGSGKSTWCSENLPDLPVISRDLIREELGMTEKGVKFMGTPEQEDEVSRISDERVIEFCKAKQSFIYDNMNSREKYRRSFYEKVKRYKPVVRYVYLEVMDLELLKMRRPEIADKGPSVFEDMVYKMEFPRPDEYDSIDIYQDLSDNSVSTCEQHEFGVLHLQKYIEKSKTIR